MKVLITGGMGFIGSNLVMRLLEHEPNLKLVNLDKLTYAGNPQNLAPIADDPRYEFVQGDIADRDLVSSLFEMHEFQYVLNLAAESMVDRSIEDSEVFVRSNVTGTQVLLDQVRRFPGTRMVQVSTDEVYGSLGPSGEFNEDSPLAPNNPYSATKTAADLLCRAYHNTYGVEVCVTRCSNNYGPRQFPEKLIPKFIAWALQDRRLPVFGDGLHVRDWLFVDDHCDAITAVMTKGEPGRVYNIGGGTEMPNLTLVRLLLERLGKPESLIEFVPDRPGHDRRYAVNHERIATELGWNPQVRFEDGIRRTIDWYLDNQAWLDAIADGSYQQQ
ncbi:MAG: dTDP-glucose 4,6-dehydratase [Planctomycetales bacterium]|nr:dTDP-glucose 4,6-dehydratase [bacterium]UNM07874.1 MAG: dTDP-glucose 4,6-dehydratase [Planctomycetales bacterium]